jgi:hypothetical protein
MTTTMGQKATLKVTKHGRGVDNNVENFTDLVGYSHADNSQPDSDQRHDLQVESTMDKEATPIDKSGVTYDHLLGVEDGGNGELNSIPAVAQEFLTREVLFLVTPIRTTSSIFWETVMNGPVVVRNFL